VSGYYANHFRDHFEASVAEAFAEQLAIGIDQVGPQFSLRAAADDQAVAGQIAERLQQLIGVPLKAKTVASSDTVEAIACFLRARSMASSRLEVPDGWRPGDATLFYCHSASGNAFSIRTLRGVLPVQLVGIRAAGLAGECEIPDSIEDFAALYAAEIEALPACRTYLLSGFSAGGMIALEVARRLRDHGAKVGFVAMFDTPAPGADQAPEDRPSEEDLMEGRLRELLRRVEGTMPPTADRKDAQTIKTLQRGLALTRDMDAGTLDRQLRVFARVSLAAGVYRPAPYEGLVHYFGNSRATHQARAWSKRIPRLESYRLRADHYENAIFADPYLRTTLARLSQDAVAAIN
jgi:thioesterase domain-containing protein